MTKVLVLYYSKNGRTKNLAKKIAAGIEQAGAIAVLRTVPGITARTNIKPEPAVPIDGDIYVSKRDLIECDGLAMGSPTHFGNMASPLKYFIDSLTDIWLKGALVDKPCCVFTSSSSMHGGQESTLVSMMLPLFHHGMCILGLPYSEPELHTTLSGCSPYGVSSVQIGDNDELSDDEAVLSVKMGFRLAQHAIKLAK
ncbi:MAG: NAD(P)H dehydrogenase (quinone) [Alphaproteobacteria bacterium]|jgi:NAD(P)H dehydrogenase (quinone)